MPQGGMGGSQVSQFQATGPDGQPVTGEELAAVQAAAMNPGATVSMQGGQPVISQSQPPGVLRGAPEPVKPAAPTEFERRMRAAREMGASEDELRRMVIGREGAAAGAKPMPAAALRMVTDANSALKEAGTVNDTLARIRQEIASDQLSLGPVRNIANQARIASGMGNEESTRFATLMTSLRGLQNAALRLNKGVQTEGDAQRIWQELLGNLNDEQAVLANIDRLMQLNQRAVELHEGNLELVNENYGRGQQAPAAPSGDIQFQGFRVLD